MTQVQILTAILGLLAGIGIFLVACSTLSHNLETLGSSKLRQLFASASKSKLLGVGIGALGTAAIQSSGAVTVIVIGFVNAGIMSLAQAATVIYGANIGTTITGQIVAWGISGDAGVSSTIIFAGLTGVGAFITSFAKGDKAKTIGGIITGFGMLFVGLEMMSGAMESFAELEVVRTFLASINSVLLLVLIGAVFTAIIQSSSVMTSIAITMVVAGLITLDQGIYLTMGSNIGSCVVAIIAGATGPVPSKRAALIHLIFNVTGVVVFLIIGFLLGMFSGGSIGFGTIFNALFPGVPQIQLAMFHTVFNVIAVIMMLPLTDLLVSVVCKLIPDAPEVPEEEVVKQHTYYISDGLLTTPPIAVQQTKNEIVNMADIALRNTNIALNIARTLDFSERETFEQNEAELNYLNRELSKYIARLYGEQLSEEDRDYLSHALHSISDLERVGDYAVNIIEYADKLIEDKQSFSEDAQDEIAMLKEFIDRLYVQVMRCYVLEDLDALENAKASEAAIDLITEQMSANHVRRMADGTCTPEVGAHYIALVSDSERIGDHFYNLAKTVRGL
ncbi:MAG: Na/Pi cotransporter family protein [Atopobiaceae bacterium]|nr:Na/Pi cotransporter family protein [Atopobiaceae bacterium]